MASNLAHEQKALNKEAAKLRDRAYRQRISAYRAEQEAADAAFASSDVARAAKEADDALNKVVEGRNAARAEITAQIAALQQKLTDTDRAYGERLEPLKAARYAAWNARRKAEQALKADIQATYSDVADCWSAAAWKPFEEFLPLAQNS